MTQEAILISETPPLPGLKLVQDVNKAHTTIATDFAGSTDPASLDGAGPYCKWADTASGLLKRRNAANTGWVVIGSLFLNAGTDHAGSEPANPIPFMTWADTANGLVKRRSADNAAWEVEGELFTYKANRNGDIAQNFKAAPAAATGDVVTYEQVLGVGQTRQVVTGSRSRLTVYTNATGKPMLVCIQGVAAPANPDRYVQINRAGKQAVIGRPRYDGLGTLSAETIIFPGETYSYDYSEGALTNFEIVEYR